MIRTNIIMALSLLTCLLTGIPTHRTGAGYLWCKPYAVMTQTEKQKFISLVKNDALLYLNVRPETVYIKTSHLKSATDPFLPILGATSRDNGSYKILIDTDKSTDVPIWKILSLESNKKLANTIAHECMHCKQLTVIDQKLDGWKLYKKAEDDYSNPNKTGYQNYTEDWLECEARGFATHYINIRYKEPEKTKIMQNLIRISKRRT